MTRRPPVIRVSMCCDDKGGKGIGERVSDIPGTDLLIACSSQSPLLWTREHHVAQQ